MEPLWKISLLCLYWRLLVEAGSQRFLRPWPLISPLILLCNICWSTTRKGKNKFTDESTKRFSPLSLPPSLNISPFLHPYVHLSISPYLPVYFQPPLSLLPLYPCFSLPPTYLPLSLPLTLPLSLSFRKCAFTEVASVYAHLKKSAFIYAHLQKLASVYAHLQKLDFVYMHIQMFSTSLNPRLQK